MSKLKNKVKLHFKLPTSYNNKKSIPAKEFIKVKNFFIDNYGGLTVDSPSTGYWKDSGISYTDEVIEYTIFIEKKMFDNKVKKTLNNQIERFKNQFKQLEILCYYHSVMST